MSISHHLKKLLICGILSVIFVIASQGQVTAKEAPKLVIMPFTIHGPEDFGYLAQEIPDVLGRYLQQEGADIVKPTGEMIDQFTSYSKDAESLRTLGNKIGADYLIYGSLTRIGDKFSLDATLLPVTSKDPPVANYVEGVGIENLLGTVKRLADKIRLKLFKQQLIAQVIVKGTKRIEPDAIRRNIKTKPGDFFSAKAISDDLKAIYAMGYFEDIRVESTEGEQGKLITFTVEEKPTIRKIKFKGNKIFDDEKIRENLNISTGSILNVFKINSNIKAIENLYKEKNYQQVKVNYEIESLANNQADLVIKIEEGQKIRIKTITFEGNTAFKDKKLKKIMKTSEKGFFSWLTSSGDLNREDLDQDISKLAAFYQNNGYIKARVGEPVIEYEDIWIFITIKIEEGPRFRVGKIDITGDLIFPKEKLLEDLKIKEEEFYNHEVVRNDMLLLTDKCADEGYAYAQVMPNIDEDLKNLIVNITFNIDKRKQVYFEHIYISGNTITRDKVIRRELKVYEGELYNGKNLKFGIRNLYRSEYFEDIRVNTPRGSSDDKMILKIDVAEKPTGQFSFGAGYGNEENLFAMASISQRNLFGRGQTLKLVGTMGSNTTRGTLSFIEPWLFDIPLSAGVDLYAQDKDYEIDDKDAYRIDSIGFKIKGGYPVFDYTRLYLSYNYDIKEIDISDDEDVREDVSDDILQLEGRNITNSVRSVLSYDSRDRMFNATEGSRHSISVEYAGFGGDIAFTKYIAETGWYFPIFWSTVGFIHGETGYVEESSGGILPDYERFYLGGPYSVRGFPSRAIHTTTLNDKGEEIAIGGNKYVQFNFEYLIPLIEKAGLMGVLFYDTGNVWGNNNPINLDDLREGAGFGVRWFSPIGPIRLEWGWILDRESGESGKNRLEFSMGSAF